MLLFLRHLTADVISPSLSKLNAIRDSCMILQIAGSACFPNHGLFTILLALRSAIRNDDRSIIEPIRFGLSEASKIEFLM